MDAHTLDVLATPARLTELDHLGDEIAELSAHLQAATARLLDLIREFDLRGRRSNTRPTLPPDYSCSSGARRVIRKVVLHHAGLVT
jgi:hypothetical protein